MADFTPTQGRYLAFIHAYTNLHGYPPAESEIAAAICVSPPSVNQMVKMLERKGLMERPARSGSFAPGAGLRRRDSIVEQPPSERTVRCSLTRRASVPPRLQLGLRPTCTSFRFT